MKKNILILLTTFLIIALGGAIISNLFGDQEDIIDENGNKQISVVTSFYPTYIIAKNLADQIPELKVGSLTDFSAGCLHDYVLTTGDMKLLSKADIFLMNGGGMEGYVEDVIKNYPELSIANISENIIMLDSEVNHDHGNDHEDADNYDHADDLADHDGHEHTLNPHVWLDPALYMLQIDNMEAGLVNYIEGVEGLTGEAKTEIIKKLSANKQAYLEEVSILNDRLDDMAQTLIDSNRNKKVVIFHESFAYLADRVGLEVAHAVEIDDDTSLSAGEIAKVIDIIREEKIEYLFTEQQYGDNITNRIEEETDAISYIIDSAVTGDGMMDSYRKALDFNLDILEKAFQ